MRLELIRASYAPRTLIAIKQDFRRVLRVLMEDTVVKATQSHIVLGMGIPLLRLLITRRIFRLPDHQLVPHQHQRADPQLLVHLGSTSSTIDQDVSLAGRGSITPSRAP